MRDIAFVVMLIGGVSTVLFNGNPLLRFDGYYVLSDLLDVPNLGPRSNAYIGYLAQRHLLGCSRRVSPVTAGRAAAAVRLRGAVLRLPLVRLRPDRILGRTTSPSGWHAGGGLFVASTMVVKPLHGMSQFLRSAPQLARSRTRSYAVAGGMAAAVVVAAVRLCRCRSPPRAQGVVWLPEQARIRAETDGFVTEVLAKDGQAVKPGDPLLVLSDPELVAERPRVEGTRSAAWTSSTRAMLAQRRTRQVDR